ncbi:hypothetical protein BHM03_00025501, partial [Ensete ventricosum]
ARSEDVSERQLGYTNSVDFSVYEWFSRSHITLRTNKKWRLGCASSNSSFADSISADSLWEDLKPTISYLAPEELKLVHDALKGSSHVNILISSVQVAFEAHDGQKRRSGEPFIIHPVEVARILGELVSKLGKLKCKSADSSVQDVKANDLRQMFLAMTEEVLASCIYESSFLTLLHLMDINEGMLLIVSFCLQSSIALETLQVFAPLAKLLGMYQIKIRTEDMDLIAERGIAAHYSGRGVPGLVGKDIPGPSSSHLMVLFWYFVNLSFEKYILHTFQIGWLNAIREWQQEFVGNMSSREFVDTVMRDLLGSRVFVFTPKGEVGQLRILPSFQVNGNLVSPMHILANAEVVEIITYNAEIDRRRGMGVMLFHFEGTLDNLVNACSSVDVILGVLGWSAGCSWSSPMDDHNFL